MEEQSNNERAFQIYVEILRIHMMDEDPVPLTNELARKYALRAKRLVTEFNLSEKS
jgi:hypothetical protein